MCCEVGERVYTLPLSTPLMSSSDPYYSLIWVLYPNLCLHYHGILPMFSLGLPPIILIRMPVTKFRAYSNKVWLRILIYLKWRYFQIRLYLQAQTIGTQICLQEESTLSHFFFFAGFPMDGKDIGKHFRDMREGTISLNNYLDGHPQNIWLRYDIPWKIKHKCINYRGHS